jgi:hypothetical protein
MINLDRASAATESDRNFAGEDTASDVGRVFQRCRGGLKRVDEVMRSLPV